MSLSWTWRQAILKTSLPATTKHVLLVISCHMNDMGEGCYPSTKTLGERCSLSERSVCSHIEDAEKAGWLAVQRHGFSGQKWARHEYMPSWPKATESDAKADKGTEPDDRKALNLTSKGTEPDAAYIDNIPNNIPVEHSKPKTKASSRALPARSIAILLEDLAETPDEFIASAVNKHGFRQPLIDDEWAKFRNHHISARSKHTRIELCWDTWCRNVPKWKRGGAAPAAGTSGQGGGKRYDPVAAAKGRAMAELFGERPEGHGGSAVEADSDACPFGGGAETVDASFVDVSPSHETRQRAAGGADGGNPDRHE
ncbi:helix-turn-helix domain-containing protein [Rhizobium leguminosarum]|uniref:helix-turn-helix domain-containing protein n=1 Tax=Rhizobium leguminosarum TaxID=384 RepID=UPI001C942028|nr:helix-turn-helix domain-containing protein [Rhizobium leguminosarum]MBY5594133.1 helix-turn-helix domain-containing protein [Rhizobium leguminosarum]